jgi:hypothetical protein
MKHKVKNDGNMPKNELIRKIPPFLDKDPGPVRQQWQKGDWL